MNLSQRLDQARRRRAAKPEPSEYELRMARDAPVYDGRHLRTGQEMTPGEWQRIRERDAGGGLPTWNPKRANEIVAADIDSAPPVIDLTSGDARVIDLRDRTGATPAGGEFGLPAWAATEQVFRGEREC